MFLKGEYVHIECFDDTLPILCADHPYGGMCGGLCIRADIFRESCVAGCASIKNNNFSIILV